jgi:hypothetical protein
VQALHKRPRAPGLLAQIIELPSGENGRAVAHGGLFLSENVSPHQVACVRSCSACVLAADIRPVSDAVPWTDAVSDAYQERMRKALNCHVPLTKVHLG